MCLIDEISRFQPKKIQMAEIHNHYETFLTNNDIIDNSKNITFVRIETPNIREGQVENYCKN